MLEYFSENWYLAVILLLVIAITVFVVIKAWKAAAKTSKEREAMLKKAEYEEKVVKEFKVLTDDLLKNSEPKRLFDGTALNIQRVLEKEENAEEKFLKLPDTQKVVYALYYFLDDSQKGLSEFYKCNGKPLTPWAAEGAKKIFPENIAKIIIEEYEAYDPDNEETSCSPEVISKLDVQYAEKIKDFDVYPALKKFISDNAQDF